MSHVSTDPDRNACAALVCNALFHQPPPSPHQRSACTQFPLVAVSECGSSIRSLSPPLLPSRLAAAVLVWAGREDLSADDEPPLLTPSQAGRSCVGGRLHPQGRSSQGAEWPARGHPGGTRDPPGKGWESVRKVWGGVG